MLIGSYARKQTRRLLARMLLAWHELAVHKTVETRSRSELRISLKAQEELTAAGEEALDEYARVLVEAERSLEVESRTQTMLTRQAEEARVELASLRLKCHTAQQECLRLRTVVRHYELRYPRAFASSALTVEGTEGMTVPQLSGGAAGDAAMATDPLAAKPAAESTAAAGGASGGLEGGEQSAPAAAASVTLPTPPLIVSRDEAERLQRLTLGSKAILQSDRYTPPAKGGTSADAELRRVKVLFSYILSGKLPDKPTLELTNIDQVSAAWGLSAGSMRCCFS